MKPPITQRLIPWLFLCLLVLPAQSAEPHPNMVFILADDQGVGDVSHAGGLAKTPHIDRLAKEGLRFTDAHTTSSVCTPTRYGILTGRYNWRSRLKKSVLFGLDQPLISAERLTVAAFLRDHGYRTGVVGKWHLGLGWPKLPNGEKRQALAGPTKGQGWDIDYRKPVSGGPLALGFDQSFIIPASLDMFPYVYLKDDLPTQEATVTKRWVRAGPAGQDFEAGNCLRDFAREARAFIAEQSNRQPFFLYLPLTSPHTPIVPSAEWQGKSALGPYGDFVMETDWVVGQVLEELAKQGIDENTMVVFATDNGCSPAAKIRDLVAKGHHPNGQWRGHKADIFEGGHRVPFLVRWPAKVAGGNRCDQTVCTADFFRTAAELIGAGPKIPDAAAEDSFSFAAALADPATAGPLRPFTVHHSFNGSFAIREGKWKLILCPGSGGWSAPKPKQAAADPSLPPVQLYNLQADPGETSNQLAKHPQLAADLAAKLAKAIREGRTTAGALQSNEGYPDTFPARVMEAYPVLRP